MALASLFPFVGVLSVLLFTGAAMYITLVEHNARMVCGPEIGLKQWKPSYRKAAKVQASLAFVGGLFNIITWYIYSNVIFLIVGLIALAIIPFTLIVILPTNHLLLAINPEDKTKHHEIKVLMGKWIELHNIRSYLGMFGSLLALWGLMTNQF